MDTADRVIGSMAKQGHSKVDPLKGINLMKEYASIGNGTSKLTQRIQDMITTRVEEGR